MRDTIQQEWIIQMMQDLCKEMKMEGGFIVTLLAGLAGNLLPSLLGGKGLYRAGVKLKKGVN